MNETNTLRAGGTFLFENGVSDINSTAFLGYFNGSTGQIVQTGTTPFTVNDDSGKTANLLGVYLQNEWKVFDSLTINYGARFDYYSAYVTDNQISPRIGAVYDITRQTQLHVGYAR